MKVESTHISKRELDVYFSEHIEEIQEYVAKRYNQKHIWDEEVDSFVSQLYIYLHKNLHRIEDTVTLKNWISTTIYNHTTWVNSSFREMGSPQKLVNRCVQWDGSYGGAESLDLGEMFNELPTDDLMIIAEDYYHECKDAHLRSTWRIVFRKKCYTILAFARHIGRSNTLAKKCIEELHADMAVYYSLHKNTRYNII